MKPGNHADDTNRLSDKRNCVVEQRTFGLLAVCVCVCVCGKCRLAEYRKMPSSVEMVFNWIIFGPAAKCVDDGRV